MKNKILVVLFTILTLLFILAVSINASDVCAHENKRVTSVEYTDYTQNGIMKFVCPSCTVTEITVSPLVNLNGYSVPTNDSELCVGYTINREAANELKKLNKEFDYGIVVAAKSSLGNNMPLDSVTSEPFSEKCIKLSLLGITTDAVDFRLTDFDASTIIEPLYFTAYAYDGNQVKYVSAKTEATPTEVVQAVVQRSEDVVVEGYSFSMIKETADAPHRVGQMESSQAAYKSGSKMKPLELLIVQGEAYVIVGGGAAMGYTNAASFLSHYLGNTGKQYNLDLTEFFKDSVALNVRNKDINRALRAAEMLAVENMKINVNQCMEQVNNVLSGDWYYSLGGYFSRINMSDVTVTTQNDVKTYSATLKYTVIDFYNWDESKTAGFLNGSGPSQYQLYQLHKAGKAREFLTVGEISYQITWTEGQTVNQIAGLN